MALPRLAHTETTTQPQQQHTGRAAWACSVRLPAGRVVFLCSVRPPSWLIMDFWKSIHSVGRPLARAVPGGKSIHRKQKSGKKNISTQFRNFDFIKAEFLPPRSIPVPMTFAKRQGGRTGGAEARSASAAELRGLHAACDGASIFYFSLQCS